MIDDHEFRPYTDMPDLCVVELSETGDTCNRPREDHEGSRGSMEEEI